MKSLLYEIRRTLFMWLMPRDLTVVLFDGVQNTFETSLFDKSKGIGWESVRVFWQPTKIKMWIDPELQEEFRNQKEDTPEEIKERADRYFNRKR